MVLKSLQNDANTASKRVAGPRKPDSDRPSLTSRLMSKSLKTPSDGRRTPTSASGVDAEQSIPPAVFVTPYRPQHKRNPSEASSAAFPLMSGSMTMLLQETPGGLAPSIGNDSLFAPSPSASGSEPPSPTLVIGRIQSSATERDFRQITNPAAPNQTPAKAGKTASGHFLSAAGVGDLSPTTTADYSFTPGSPGSLVLRPEDERHLGDLQILHNDLDEEDFS